MYCTAGGILLYLLLKSATAEKEVDIIDFLPCLDHKGKEVEHGDRFFPFGSDPCTQCTCLHGKPQMCIAVFCSPPENCRQYQALSDKCCEFVCLDRDFPNKASGNGTYPGKDDGGTSTFSWRSAPSNMAVRLQFRLQLFELLPYLVSSLI